MSVSLKKLLKTDKELQKHLLKEKDELNLLFFLQKLNEKNKCIIKRGKSATEKYLSTIESKKAFIIIPVTVSPLDLISHLFSMAHEKDVKYFFISENGINEYKQISKNNSLSSCMLIDLEEKSNDEIKEIFMEIEKIIFF